MWKMQKGGGIGCLGWGITQGGRGISGLCMGFLREGKLVLVFYSPLRFSLFG
jgi:hypothetical protein